MNSEKKNRITLYGVILGIVCFVAQYAIYRLANVIAGWIGITPFLPKIDQIDDLIPLVPSFIIPYVWSYVYWATTPMVVSKCDLKHFLNYVSVWFIACFVGAIVLVFAPSYMDRVAEGILNRPENNIFDKLLQIVYVNDGGEMAFNLFPSFHCMLSLICLLGTFRKKEIKLWYRIYSLVMFILIVLSTLFTKQHYFIDTLGGLTIGLIVYFLCFKFDISRIYNRPIEYFKNRKENKKNQEK
ncbi:MAG: phosphatase PAP2 family protein [Gammaproteobacteria bacterium]|nr:phosphatase PAP2 family protein [Gammaproteobacteria bacterium]